MSIGGEYMRSRFLIVGIMAVFLLTTTLLPFVSACTERPPSLPREIEGGHAVLVEEYTATWCEFCAEVDPWMEDVMGDHYGRAYRIAIHPDDSDPLGNPAATHRLLRHSDPSNQSLPTFWYDGVEGSTGVIAQWRVSQGIIAAEDNRASSTQFLVENLGIQSSGINLKFEIEGEQYAGTQITIIIKDSLARLSGSEAANGITEHRDVVVGLVEIDLTDDSAHIAWAWPHGDSWVLDNSSYDANQKELFLQLPSGNLDLPTGLEVVLIHESDAGGEDLATYGVVGLEIQNRGGGSCQGVIGGIFSIGYDFLTTYSLLIVLFASLILLVMGRRRLNSPTKGP